MTASPENNTHLTKNYGKSSLKGKSVNKLSFQKEHSIIEDKTSFLVGITTEMTEKNNGDELVNIIQGLLAVGIQVAIRGKGTDKYQKLLTDTLKNHSQHCCIVEDKEKELDKMFAAIDVHLSLDGENTKSLQQILNYGAVPVSYTHKNLENFNALEEKGNAFIFSTKNTWNIFEALIRAKENFKFPYDWKNLQIACMETSL